MSNKIPSLSSLEYLLNSLPDAIIITDGTGEILLANQQTNYLFNYNHNALLGQKIEVLMPLRFRNNHLQYRNNYSKNPVVRPMGTKVSLFGLKNDGGEFPIDIKLSPLHTQEGRLLLASIRDLSERKLIEEKLKNIAEHDSLTGLINRPLFNDRLSKDIIVANRYHNNLAVLFLDLDNFKQINDNFGHDVGDIILRCAAECIQKCVRAIDSLARIGGDEFVLVLSRITKEEDAIKVAKKIINKFAKGFKISNKKIFITLSIGIALYPKNYNQDDQELIEKADASMYFVKKNGKNNFKIFDELCHF